MMIGSELLKVAPEKVLKLLLSFTNIALERELITTVWCKNMIIPIHKEGPRSNPENYRGICLMNTLLKTLCIMMNDRLTKYIAKEKIIDASQIGFKKGCRTSDHIFTLKSIINKQVYDNKKKLYACFIDFKKAFDSVWHEGLFHKLEQINVNGNFLNLLKSI